CFFFSSRRRHTRSKRDWSSDVCSSDLRKVIYRVDKIFRVAILSGSSLQQCFFLLRLAILSGLQSLIQLLHLLAGESVLEERNLDLGAVSGFESKLFNRHVGSPK